MIGRYSRSRSSIATPLRVNWPSAPQICLNGGSGQVNKPPANAAISTRLTKGATGDMPGKPPGNLYVLLEVQQPPADRAEATELYQTMSEELPFNPRADM